LPKLHPAALLLLNDLSIVRAFSAAAIWEIAIKSARGRSDFVANAAEVRDALLTSGFRELPITAEHVLAVRDLPPIHRDPFDRLLVAQASVEDLTLVTADGVLEGYPACVMVM
jgi:PIN domain nuclease of toxin-antitoxin system